MTTESPSEGRPRRVRVIARLPPSNWISWPPIQPRPGERLQVGERSAEWPAYVAVTTVDEGTGWVPARILRVEGDTGTVLTEYDTTSLDPEVGEELEVLADDTEGRWL